MSGNQYVYSIEISNADGGSNRLDLVHKTRKLILRRAESLIAKLDRTHRLVQETHHRDLSLLTFIHKDRSTVSDHWYFAPTEEYRGQLPGVEITVRAWIIKYAKPEGPVRGTLKERMGDRAWKPTIELDEPCENCGGSGVMPAPWNEEETCKCDQCLTTKPEGDPADVDKSVSTCEEVRTV